ncbi:MAG: resuscitation-promoting factor RpfE [Thermoleophilaceae bacterium]|nr:resuscitation-promoting factor RpfE [Thermoleophilaceae bacterium]
MRKLLASLLCVAVAVPAVAFASDAANVKAAGAATAGEVNLALQAKAVKHAFAAKDRADKRARQRRARRRRQAAAASTASPALQAIARCESGGNPRAIGGGGTFRGKYQFDQGTWASVGGSGDPAAAPEAEQDKRAAMLYARSGSTPWPVCGH